LGSHFDALPNWPQLQFTSHLSFELLIATVVSLINPKLVPSSTQMNEVNEVIAGIVGR
jgi:hypothetical protein